MSVPIIIVDDDEIDRYLAARAIESAPVQCQVKEFNAGDHFLDALMDRARREAELGTPPPKLLLVLDINMPRMSGFQVLEQIEERVSEDAKLAEICVVLMFSSSAHAEDQAKALKYSFVSEYAVKPLTEEHICRVFREHFPEYIDEQK